MKDHESQQRAIAEACGISGIQYVIGRGLVYIVRTEGGMEERRVPNYLKDLNALHEAEKVLTEKQRDAYCARLSLAVFNEGSKRREFGMVHASAEQRSDALLATIGELNP